VTDLVIKYLVKENLIAKTMTLLFHFYIFNVGNKI